MLPLLAVLLVAGACNSSDTATTTTGSVAADNYAEIPIPPPPAPIAPVLRRPGPPGEALAGLPIVLGGLVLAQHPIVRLELWNGSELVEAADFNDRQTEIRTAWDWAPPEAGLFGLVLRAIDVNGETATSFPLWVRAVQPEAPPPAATALGHTGVPAMLATQDEPATPTFPAEALSPGPLTVAMDEESCAASLELPAVQGASGIAVYAAPMGSTGFVPAGLVPAGGGEVALAMGAAPLMVYAEGFDDVDASPGAPLLVFPPESCGRRGWTGDLAFANGVLANSKGADRAYLYVSRDGGELWDRVPAADQSFVHPGPDGGFDFSDLLSPPAPGSEYLFEAWGWVAGTLTPLGRGSWTTPGQAPTGSVGSATIPSGGDFVMAPYAGPMIPDSDLDWIVGFQVENLQTTDKPVLLRSGTICTYPPQAATPTATTSVPVSVVGGNTVPPATPTTVPPIGLLPDECTNAPLGQYSKTFRWRPQPGDISHGLLQVSTLPPPADPVLAFPGLVYTLQVDKPGGDFVDFEVPLDEIIDPPPIEASLPDYESMSYELVAGLAGLAPGGGTGGSPQAVEMVPPPVMSGLDASTYYLRVLPMKGTTPLPGESNSVMIGVDEDPPPKLEEPTLPPALSLEIRMTPPHLPNAGYGRCVRVVENPFGSKNPPPSQTPQWFEEHVYNGIITPTAFDNWYLGMEQQAFIFENGQKVNKGMIPGSTVCAWKLPPPDKDWWDYVVDAVEFIGVVWDAYVTVWELMKNWVAEVVAYASGCVAIAEKTGKSTAEAEALCSGIAKAAITTALAFYGVPPTMPKFKDLAELGKGELKQWVIDKAVAAGLDCGPVQSECEDMAEDLLDELLDEMQVAATQATVQAASAGSQWVLMIHPGIYVIPEPAGTLSPALFEIEITRSIDPNAPAPPPTCSYQGHVFGNKQHYEWQNYNKGYWQTGPVDTAAVVKSKSVTVDLTGLQPGETTEALLTLDQIVPWYPEGQHPQLPNVPYWNVKPQTWIFFTDLTSSGKSPTTLTTALYGGPQCGGAVQAHPQDTTPTEPWEIPAP